MKERPIIFKAEMVNAILDGSKTQTRRIIKKLPEELDWHFLSTGGYGAEFENQGGFLKQVKCPQGQIGDKLWVRETFCDTYEVNSKKRELKYVPHDIEYRADCGIMRFPLGGNYSTSEYDFKWKPSIFMPRELSRINLEIIGIRVERLNDISEEDARAEGFERLKSGRGYYNPTLDKSAVRFGEYCYTAKEAFEELWESINGLGSWEENPFVWCIDFKKVD